MNIYDKLLAKTENVKARDVNKPENKAARAAPTIFLNATQRMDAAEALVEELEKKLESFESSGERCFEIPLEFLHEVTGRRRNLSTTEYEELRGNLQNNELVTPITVRYIDNKKYEIISGHNRVAVFRELNRKSILGVVSFTDEIQADINAFYANLLQPNLPDYEKYLGFCMIQKKCPNMSHEAIAELAGVSRSQITKLMSFSGLPKEAHAVLINHVAILGANAALDMAKLIKQGQHAKVVEAIKKLAVGEFDQKQAVKFATDIANKTEKPTDEPKIIKNGNATYCAINKNKKIIRLEFATAEEAQYVEAEITELLNKRASKIKL